MVLIQFMLRLLTVITESSVTDDSTDENVKYYARVCIYGHKVF